MITLTLWCKPWWGDPAEFQSRRGSTVTADVWRQERIAAFERAHPDIKVLTEIDPGPEKLQLAFASRTAPDVFFSNADNDAMRYASLGLLEPLDAFLPAQDRADLYPPALEAGRLGKNHYLWPLYNHALVLLVNRTLCDQRRVAHLLPAPGASWDTTRFLRVARALTFGPTNSKRPEVYGVGIYAGGDMHYFMTTWLLNWGARLFDERRGFIFNSPETRQGLRFLLQMTAPGGVAPQRATAYKWADMSDLFFAQKVGMILTSAGQIDYGALQVRTGRIRPFKVQLCPIPTALPSQSSRSFLTVGAVAVSYQKSPERRRAAMELARYLTGPQVNQWFWSKWASPRRSTPLPDDPNRREMMKLVVRSENFMLPPVPLNPRYDLPRQLDLFYQRVFSGDSDVEAALRDFEAQFYKKALIGVKGWPSAHA